MAEREEIKQEPEVQQNPAEDVSAQATSSFMNEINDDRARSMTNESITNNSINRLENSANNSLDNSSASGAGLANGSESSSMANGGGGGGRGREIQHKNGEAQTANTQGVLAKEASGTSEGSKAGMDSRPNGAQVNSMDKEALNRSGSSSSDAEMNSQKNTEKMSEKIVNNDNAMKSLKDGLINSMEKKDGVKELPTGDHLVRKDGNETLFTPNGESVTINKDGSTEINGDAKMQTDKDGNTKVTFKDGATVTFDKHGIKDVNRGDKSAHIAHPEDIMNKGNKEKEQGKPRPWPGGESKPGNGGDGPRPLPPGGERPPLTLPKPRPTDGPQKPNGGDRPQGPNGGDRPPSLPKPGQNDKPVRIPPVIRENILPNIEIKK